MKLSIKEQETKNNTRLKKGNFYPARSNTHQEGFVVEHLFILHKTKGQGILDPHTNLFNKINSPGKKLWEAFEKDR